MIILYDIRTKNLFEEKEAVLLNMTITVAQACKFSLLSSPPQYKDFIQGQHTDFPASERVQDFLILSESQLKVDEYRVIHCRHGSRCG